MLVIPPFLGAVGYKMICYYRNFYIRENGKPREGYDMLLLFYCIVSVIVVVIMIMLYQNIKAAQEEKSANRLLSAQIDHLKRHIEQVETLYQDIRSMKHDMTNHVLMLERLYAANETKEAKDYVQDLKAKILKAILTIISVCTLVMIASSAMRMTIYIQYYYLASLSADAAPAVIPYLEQLGYPMTYFYTTHRPDISPKSEIEKFGYHYLRERHDENDDMSIRKFNLSRYRAVSLIRKTLLKEPHNE